MKSDRVRRKQISSCNQVPNIFNGRDGPQGLAEQLPQNIYKQLASKSMLTCLSIINLKQLKPSSQLEAEYETMKLASNYQTNYNLFCQKMGSSQNNNLAENNQQMDESIMNEEILAKHEKTVTELLRNSQFLQKLNQWVFENPSEKTLQISTKNIL